MSLDPTQFLGLPSPGAEHADALLLPLPVEKTVSYGRGTCGGPKAIIEASLQIETFDEETLVEFADSPRLDILPPPPVCGEIEECLSSICRHVCPWRGKFLLALGGEHTVSHAVVSGLFDDPTEATIVQLDAHADLIDELEGRRWSHGTVMRRLWEQGCRLMQIGIRSLSGEEHHFLADAERITTFYAHRMNEQWPEIIDTLRRLEGKVYLTIDVDALDPSIVPSTGTPLPGGLSWSQAMDVLRALTIQSQCQLVGGDVVEFVPSPSPPGCDPTVARLVTKLLAYWWSGHNASR